MQISDTMMAAVLHGDGDIRFERIPTPELALGSVLVHVRAAGVCGSDLPRVFQSGAFFYPIVLGHEFSGEVAAAAPDVTSVRVGQRVAGAPLVPCMHCDDCMRGYYASCRSYSFLGSKKQGAFAEYVAMPAMCAVPLPDGVSYEQGAMLEPATVGLHALFCAGFQGGGDVAVLGGGTIGLFVMQWARIYGARSVTVFDISEERLTFLRGYGVDHTVDTTKDGFLETCMALTGGAGFSHVFETAGQAMTMNLAFRIAATKADVCFVGTPHADLTFPPATWELFNRRELRLTGPWMSYSAPYPGREWTLTAHHLARGDLRIDEKLVAACHPMREVAAAFGRFQDGPVAGKVLLLNDGEDAKC